jgi:hypothetical protein
MLGMANMKNYIGNLTVEDLLEMTEEEMNKIANGS